MDLKKITVNECIVIMTSWGQQMLNHNNIKNCLKKDITYITNEKPKLNKKRLLLVLKKMFVVSGPHKK